MRVITSISEDPGNIPVLPTLPKPKVLKIPLPDGMSDSEALSLLIAAVDSHHHVLLGMTLPEGLEVSPTGAEMDAAGELCALGPLKLTLEIEGIRHGIC